MDKIKKNSEEYMIGKRFERLIPIKRGPEKYFQSGRHRDTWLCKCDCGNEKIILGPDLRRGSTVSCGCKHKEGMHRTHGKTNTRLYKEYQDMKARCYNKNNKLYYRYGARGITICDEWGKFEGFYKWAIENGYTDELTIDRIDNDGPYAPWNCRYVSIKKQMNNMSRNRIIEYNGERHTVSEWGSITGISSGAIRARLDRFGWPVERALTERVHRN